ncbi:hypothetical protein EON83_22015 [bacterium]|nr:MAG: hypothetical protein EON83_22015 [bacterium]
MNKHFYLRSAVSALILSLISIPTVAYYRGDVLSDNSEKTAITSALKQELSRETSSHIQVPEFEVSSLDVRANWGLVNVKPLNTEKQDSVLVLVRKMNGKWNFVTLGGDLRGAGKQFKVPRSLWNPWNLTSDSQRPS